MPLLIGLAAGGALGAGKAVAQNAQADRQKLIQGETTRYSPWTHMTADAPKYGDVFGDVLSGAAGGGMFGAGLNTGAEKGIGSMAEIPSPAEPLSAQIKGFNPMGGGGGGMGIPGANQFMPGGGSSPWGSMAQGNTFSPGGWGGNKYRLS